jgi:hypothetical protein
MFAHKIIRLEITNSYINIDFSQFPNLLSLTMHRANDNHLIQIRHQFMPNLTCLFISIFAVTLASTELTQNLFSNQLPALRYVDLGLISLSNAFLWSCSPFLYSLCIHCSEPILIQKVLMACPNLKRFQVKMTPNDLRNDLSEIKPINHSLKYFILFDSPNSLSSETIDKILLCIPNIKQLYLQYHCKDLFLVLAQILVRRLKYLTRFDCNIFEAPHENENDHLDTIRQIHPVFNRLLCTVKPNGYRLFTTDGLYAKANLFLE